MLYNDHIFKNLLQESSQFYKRAMQSPDQMSRRCNEVQSWSLKETSYDYVVTLLDLFKKLFDEVAADDFKYMLAQCFQWYQGCSELIKDITTSEQATNLFDKEKSD